MEVISGLLHYTREGTQNLHPTVSMTSQNQLSLNKILEILRVES